MSSLFKQPSTPTYIPYVSEDTGPNSADLEAAAQAEAELLRKKKGFLSTILTGPSGITDGGLTYSKTLG
jgi:hypothetical protein